MRVKSKYLVAAKTRAQHDGKAWIAHIALLLTKETNMQDYTIPALTREETQEDKIIAWAKVGFGFILWLGIVALLFG